ncbi:hypothetical protein B0H65DRAFT_11058 [Neurospora tetraspora]|uniref:Uncharacterized protein n=1 Tax=Neurospora tetraspora TaxID=94610 RepID=A0AAE0JN62_9PEZI|nr:hypothetical protein B0H65DRAFT_11058 [Neurospora tetraspora]
MAILKLPASPVVLVGGAPIGFSQALFSDHRHQDPHPVFSTSMLKRSLGGSVTPHVWTVAPSYRGLAPRINTFHGPTFASIFLFSAPSITLLVTC